jgi:hemerythrin superfamily protein
MERFEEFEQRVLSNMDAKISFLHESTGQLKNSFGEFQEEIGEFMNYVAEHVSDHEQRLSRIEKHIGF